MDSMSNAKPILCRFFISGAAVSLVSTLACDVDLGTRYTPPPRTFGEIVYGEVCERVAYSGELDEYQAGTRTAIDASGVAYRPMCIFNGAIPAGAPPIMQSVAAERQTIVSDVNLTVPESLLDPLDRTLRGMLPAMDGEAGRKMMLGGGSVLLSLAADPTAASALGRVSWRDGFRPPGTEGNVVRGLLALPDLYATASVALPVLYSSADGVDDAPGAADRLSLLRGIGRSVTASAAVPKPGASDRTMNLALRFLFTENVELRTLPAGQNLWGVLRDSRGMPQVNAPGGVLPAQFTDADRDGLADLDGLGHFKGVSGTLADVTPFPLLDRTVRDNAAGRDADGRALVSSGGAALYRYLNLDDTVLAALLRDTPLLLDPQRDIPVRMAAGMKLLLGPRQAAHKDYSGATGLDYNGFDTTQAPLLDLLHGYVQLLGYSDLGDGTGVDMARMLRGVYLLMQNQESVMARNMQAIAKAFDEGKKPAYDAAKLAEDSALYDDLAPVLVRLLRVPGLVPDVVASLQDPAVAGLGPLLARLMNEANYVSMNQAVPDWKQAGSVVGTFGRTVNRSLPDADVDMNSANAANNRSVMQRVLHLVHDANNLPFCNKNAAYVDLDFVLFKIKIAGPADPCTLYKVDDLAQFFILSIADKSIRQTIPFADFFNSLVDGTLRAGSIAAETFGLLDNLLGIPNFSRYPEPQELARLLFQDNGNRADMFKTTLDFGACNPLRPGTLCCNQNHSWQNEHNGVLFALELDVNGNRSATDNFYTHFRPVVNAFARHDECASYGSGGACMQTRNAAKILVDLLAVLHRHWPTVQSKFYGKDYEMMSKKSGVSHYEPLIAQLLGQGDLWPSSLALAPALLNTRVDDGSNISVATLVGNFARWFFDPQALRLGASLTYRDGRNMAMRNDGTPTFAPTGDMFIRDVLPAAAQGKPTPYDLLAEAYRRKRAALATSPDVEVGWKAAVSNLADIYLSSRPVTGGYKFQNPRIRSVELALVDLIRSRVQGHATAGDLKAWVSTDLLGDIASSLTGPVGAGFFDVIDRLGASPEARQKVPALLSALMTDPGPTAPDASRFRGLLLLTADLLQLLIDDGDLVPMLQKLGPAIDPDNGALDGALAVARRGLPADPDQVLIQLAKNLYKADTFGLYPAFRFGNVLNEINRQNAGQPGVFGSLLGEADYKSIVYNVGRFLADHQRGGVRLVDIVQSRNLAP